VEEDHISVSGHLTVGLDVLRSRGLRGRECTRRVLPQRRLAVRDEAAVREDPRVPRPGEEGVRHAPGCEPPGPWRGVNALPMPLRASVSSLGTIHSLLDGLSLIFGSICRYWYASSLSSGRPSWMEANTF